jgi:competence protein ComEA
MAPLGVLLALWFVLSAQSGLASSKPIDVNTASAAELTALKGIGQVKAEAIVQYREKHGGFQTVDDLKLVRGIGDKLLEQIRPQVTVGSTATQKASAGNLKASARR